MMEAVGHVRNHTTVASHHTTVAPVYRLERTIAYISVPICVFGFIVNVMLALSLFNKVKRTKFTVYLFNIAAADLSILIYHIILFILFLEAIPASPRFLLRLELMHELTFCISMYLLTAVSTERFLGLLFPDFYNRVRPLNFTIYVCLVLWGLATIMALVIHLSCNVKADSVSLSCSSGRICYMIVNFAFFSPLLVFTTVGLYVRMKNLPVQNPVVRLDKTIVTTVVMFFILAASIKTVEILAYWFPELHKSNLYAFFPLIDSIQSSGKPFLYIFIGHSRNIKDRERFHLFLERALMDERFVADIAET